MNNPLDTNSLLNKEIGETMQNEISFCENGCFCMTKTKNGKCLKCGQMKKILCISKDLELIDNKYLELDCQVIATNCNKKSFKLLQSHIQSLLTQQRTELLKEIKAIVEEQLFWYQGEDYGSITAREALNQVKNLLNKKDE